jgi:ABC-type multidrug transport system ATPase subunit
MKSTFNKYFLEKVKNDGYVKKIYINQRKKEQANYDSKNTIKHEVHRLALLGKEDEILISKKNKDSIFINNYADQLIPINPCYQEESNITFAKKRYKILYKELENEEDFRAYNYLSTFHYRTKQHAKSSSSITTVGGRNAVILSYLKINKEKIPLGYIQLQQPLMMCKPRHNLFAFPFEHTNPSIHWQSWDAKARNNFTNLIVRIGRVVTDPEYRGIGISRYLIESARKYSISRWHIRGQPPLFMEISAEMLNYIDFVSSSGFRYIGLTEGNLKRITSDLRHIEKVIVNNKIKGGILSVQKGYLTKFIKACELMDKNWKDELVRLEEICNNPSLLYKIKFEEMALFRSVLRLPIPYYLLGLDDITKNYIDDGLAQLNIEVKNSNYKSKNIYNLSVTLKNYSIHNIFKAKPSKSIRQIMSAFGIERKFNQTLLQELNFTAKKGSIVFIWGTSGSGKSIFLESLDKVKRNKNFNYAGSIALSKEVKIGWMSEIRSNDSIIDYFSNKWGMENAISAMNTAGLSEATLYIKSYKMLSTGQKYRARLAKLILQKKTVWLIDEFCADLDPMTAKVISISIVKYIKKNNLIGFFASANYQHFIEALSPTNVIILKHGMPTKILSNGEYKNEFY